MSYYPARTAARPRGGIGLLGIVYLIAGAIVAATHHYYAHLHSLKGIGSAVLAILLWPLLFLGSGDSPSSELLLLTGRTVLHGSPTGVKTVASSSGASEDLCRTLA